MVLLQTMELSVVAEPTVFKENQVKDDYNFSEFATQLKTWDDSEQICTCTSVM